MKLEEAMKLEAGRALDAIVAEKVFGWQVLGFADAWAPDGCWSIRITEDERSLTEPIHLSRCECELMEKEYLDTDKQFPGACEDEFSFKRRYGHFTLCCEVVSLFSTDIAAAWMVVEKINMLEFELYRENYDGVRYDAVFYNQLDAKDRVCITEETAPLAICLAALRVCWEDEP